MEEKTCEICDQPTQSECGGCHKVFYCSKDHQKLDWGAHKNDCRPFKISNDEHLGRHLVARQAIKEGEVILQEYPLVVGPRQEAPPVCVGCLKFLKVKKCTPCEACGLPLCSKACQGSPSHVPECYYISNRGGLGSMDDYVNPNLLYKYIWGLRCLYQKKFAPLVWEKLNKLEYRDEEIRKTEAYEIAKESAVTIFYDLFRLGDEFSVDELMKLWGILTVHGQEIPVASPLPSAIYELSSIIQHSCRANCYRSVSSDGLLQIIAGTPIQKGERLSICHTYHLWTTVIRQRFLYQTKFIQCRCERCLDVTEFGTNFSALQCKKEKCEGVLLPVSFISGPSPWVCTKCKYEIQQESVDEVIAKAEKDYTLTKPDCVSAYKGYLEKYAKVLPPAHGYMVNVKISLTCLIGRTAGGGLDIVSDDDLELKIDLCRELLDVMKIIAPAEKRFKIDMMTQLQRALEEMCRRKGDDASFDSLKTIEILKERKSIMNETEKYLKYELDAEYVEQICRSAKEKLKID